MTSVFKTALANATANSGLALRFSVAGNAGAYMTGGINNVSINIQVTRLDHHCHRPGIQPWRRREFHAGFSQSTPIQAVLSHQRALNDRFHARLEFQSQNPDPPAMRSRGNQTA